MRAACIRGAHPLARGVRHTQAVSPRRLFVPVHLLHAGAASLGRIGIQPYRDCTGRAPISESARGSRTRRPDAHCRPPARAASDACKSRRGAGGRTAQEQAGDSGADCFIEPSSGGGNHHPAGGAATVEWRFNAGSRFTQELRHRRRHGRPSSRGHEVDAPPASKCRAAIVTPLAPEHYKLQVTLRARRTKNCGTRRRLPDTRCLMGRRLDSRSRVDTAHRASRAAQVCPCGVTAAERRARILHQDANIPAAVRRAVWQRDGGTLRVRRTRQAGAARPRSSSSITSSRTRREAQPRQTTSSSAAGRTTSMRRACSSVISSSASDRRCGAQSIGLTDVGFVARALSYNCNHFQCMNATAASRSSESWPGSIAKPMSLRRSD